MVALAAIWPGISSELRFVEFGSAPTWTVSVFEIRCCHHVLVKGSGMKCLEGHHCCHFHGYVHLVLVPECHHNDVVLVVSVSLWKESPAIV